MAPVLNLNNEVVKMRKDVKKVKVLTIRRLTRQIGKLKSKKGTEELVQKNQRRAQRLLEEIQTIKKLKPDDITKTGLQKEVNFEKVCKKANCTLETRAIARLATHPLLKQKISSIKDAVKEFKEARKNPAAESDSETEKTCIPINPVSKGEESKPKPGKPRQKRKAVKKEPKNKSMDSHTSKMPRKEPGLTPSNKTYKVDDPRSKKKGQESRKKFPSNLEESAVKSKPETKTVEGQPEKTAVASQPEKTAVAGQPEKTAVAGQPEKTAVAGQPEKTAVAGQPEKTAVAGQPEKTAVAGQPENDLERKALKAASSLCESGTDSSDIDDSDKEDKEYFDDSTEERFHKKTPGFEDSDSGSEDDFFIGKVRQTKKRLSKTGFEGKVKKKLPAEPLKRRAGNTEDQKRHSTIKTVKLESVFCKSLSQAKPKPSFMKRETKLPSIRNMKSAVPQANTLLRKPLLPRGATTKAQSKFQDQSLHPSWEASRKRKEQSQIAVFQGKKIVFDD